MQEWVSRHAAATSSDNEVHDSSRALLSKTETADDNELDAELEDIEGDPEGVDVADLDDDLEDVSAPTLVSTCAYIYI